MLQFPQIVKEEEGLMMARLSEEAKKILNEVHPAQVATASKDGKPNVSARGSFRVLDDEHVVFTDQGQLYTLVNLRENPQLSAIVLDPSTRKGCRIWGRAEILESGDLFDTISAESASRGKALKYLIKVAVEEAATFEGVSTTWLK